MPLKQCNSCGTWTDVSATRCPRCYQPYYDVFNASTSVSLSKPLRVSTSPKQPQTSVPSTNDKKTKAVDGFVIENGILTYYCGYFVNVTIPETVVEIASDAFNEFRQYLNSVTLPKSLKRIGKGAFKDCVNLYNVIFNDQLESIEDEAFRGCNYLANIELPDSLIFIGKHAFNSCKSLTNIRIPKKITEVSTGTFEGCSSLVNVIFPDQLWIIRDGAFMDCYSLKNVVLPDSMEAIGMRAFKNCKSIESITIPEKCNKSDYINETKKVYGGEIFMGCSALKRVTSKSNLTRIIPRMYKDCVALSEISIPDNVEIIHEGAFENCSSLKCINLPSSVQTIENRAFKGCAKLERVIVENDSKLKMITSSAFEDCCSLTAINLPDGLVKIEINAFKGCYSLEEIRIPNNTTIDVYSFAKTPKLKLFLPNSVNNVKKLAIAAEKKNIVLCNTASEMFNRRKKYKVPEIDEYTWRNDFGRDDTPHSLLSTDLMKEFRINKTVTLILVRTFTKSGKNVYDFMPYTDFAKNCVGLGDKGQFENLSDYEGFSANSLDEDQSKLQSLFSGADIGDYTIDIIEAPYIVWANGFLLSSAKTQAGSRRFVRVVFPYKN